ncbi:adenosylcobalamin-dependent ribonucleoside-diphosphate reductase [Aquisalimonas sp.]|uniref:adenosylcobalamin-dependent ribonucleoside-diphosphate reductase n=1 Tax=Aquisalimonas sp. TaxID=1872621 RepID=UPI0025BBDBCC|nr:adenosylcobalamin-dependent ribonucleoside-diphosphate reductase [Aquisalimonas sp.]
MATSDWLETDIARHIWATKYRYQPHGQAGEAGIEASWRRIAEALSAPEADASHWCTRFQKALKGFRFLPGGRIQAGAGTDRDVTLFNCFVMGVVEDDMACIFNHLKEAALTMQRGGGIGCDFSTLRPAGTVAHGSGTIASGPVSFMRIWDSMCATILSTGARRGAMMATLRCDHPDIETFIDTKSQAGELTRFNVSVQVTDAFMEAVENNADWALVFPEEALDGPAEGTCVYRQWTGQQQPVPCRILRWVPARELWERIMRATYNYAEPGVLFVDRVNHWNNLGDREHITATNPCGEIPLPPYGACDLGSINLTCFVRAPFTKHARLDWQGLEAITATATRMLDNVIDVSRFPLPQQAERVRGDRRIGLGITGLGDALIMLGLHYASDDARATAAKVMRTICLSAYGTSVDLARTKGAFLQFHAPAYLARPFVQGLPDDIRDGIARHGMRNSHLIAIAPSGTISLLAGNISSGIEPVYQFRQQRWVLDAEARRQSFELTDYAYRLWRQRHPDAMLPAYFVDALQVEPEAHLAMEAALQPWVDNAISKTINVPQAYSFEAFRDLYKRAYALGLKGCTTYRVNAVRGAVLTPSGEASGGDSDPQPEPHCCNVEREAD